MLRGTWLPAGLRAQQSHTGSLWGYLDVRIQLAACALLHNDHDYGMY
jgi:hypothetical protein